MLWYHLSSTMEKFTCLESTARLAVQLEYAMTYPPEDRPQGSLQERWSNLPGDRARVGGSTASTRSASRTAPPCLPQDKCGPIFHGLSAHVLCLSVTPKTSLVRLCLRLFSSHKVHRAHSRAPALSNSQPLCQCCCATPSAASLAQCQRDKLSQSCCTASCATGSSDAAGRNRRTTTLSSPGDRRRPAEQGAALPAADVVPRLDRAVPALADRRRGVKARADVEKVARVVVVSGPHLAAARGVERRFFKMRGTFISVFSRGELAARLCGTRGRAEQGFAGRGRFFGRRGARLYSGGLRDRRPRPRLYGTGGGRGLRAVFNIQTV